MKDVEEALQSVIDIIRTDGGDLQLESVNGSTVELRLELKDASCADCVMPRQFLEGVAQDALAEGAPWVTDVRIHDPRESPETRL